MSKFCPITQAFPKCNLPPPRGKETIVVQVRVPSG